MDVLGTSFPYLEIKFCKLRALNLDLDLHVGRMC